MQHYRLLMFTSCGWFFDELSGIEGVQILRYAARALELAAECGAQLEAGFLTRLRLAPSNLPELGDGARIFQEKVQTAHVDFPRVVANQAICGILEHGRPYTVPAAFATTLSDYEEDTYGTTGLGVGRLTLDSRLTLEAREYAFAVLKLTNHDVHCVVSEALVGARFAEAKQDLLRIFARHSLSEVVRAFDRRFGEAYYTAKDLFLDARRRVLAGVSESVLLHLEEVYRQLYRENQRLMEYLRELDVPLPRAFSLAAEFLLNRAFVRTATNVLQDGGDGKELGELVAEAQKWQVPLETRQVEEMLRYAVEERVERLLRDPLSPGITDALQFCDLAERVGVSLNLWWAQTLFAQVCQQHLQALLTWRLQEEAAAQQVALLRQLGERLGFSAVEGVPLHAWEKGA
jgi:hypothetical protein